MRVVVVGLGAVGRRAARQLVTAPGVAEVVVAGRRWESAVEVAEGLGVKARPRAVPEAFAGADAVVLATPCGSHAALAAEALASGAHVVSTADAVAEVEALLALAPTARRLGRVVTVGGAAPGLTCVLAAAAASLLDRVDEVHVAKAGTGGPACARQRHAALAGRAADVRAGHRDTRPGGSGRELVWFCDPVRGLDCYRAALADPILLGPAFPGAARLTARVAATRRDRLTAWLPMLRRPHPEGLLGAVRVEVRGESGGVSTTVVLGASGPPAVLAGAVASVAARAAVEGRLGAGGAAGLASLVDPPSFLAALGAAGVRTSRFEGSA